jgi:hypothetical protein
MKGVYGLGIALALGIAGALFNFVYLSTKLQDVEKVALIGIKPDKAIARGETIKEADLIPIEVPAGWIGNLNEVADRWEVRNTVVVGKPVWRTLNGPRILLRDDYRTAPPEQLVLGEREIARFIAVDTRSFIPALLVPGDEVSFLVPRNPGPTPAVRPTVTEEDNGDGDVAGGSTVTMPAQAGTDSTIGPFKVLSVGSRLASSEIWRSNRIPTSHENVLTIRVSSDVAGEVQRADELFRRWSAVEFRPLAIQIDKQGGQAPPQ